MSHGKVHRIEVFITTTIGRRTNRVKVADGTVLKDHFLYQMSREHDVKINKKGKSVFIPRKEMSLMLYVKYKPKKS